MVGYLIESVLIRGLKSTVEDVAMAGGYTVVWSVLAYCVLINAVTFGFFAVDKNAAKRGDWRISESTLLLQALIGGSLGAIAAQRLLRHKTRKEPFRTMLYAIVIFQLGALSYFYVNGMPRAVVELMNGFAHR
jgi:uncharacterized membrane protein YsdA (DUF1294 family)